MEKKRNAIFDRILNNIPKEDKIRYDLSFQISERIYEILKEKKMTQKEFAQLMHKSEPEISKWLTGGHNFTMKTISKIEAVLDEPIITVSQKQQPKTMPLIIIGNFSQNLSFTPQDTNRGTNEYATNCTYMSRHTFDN